MMLLIWLIFFFQAEDGIRDLTVTGVQTCALPIWSIDLENAAMNLPIQGPYRERFITAHEAGAGIENRLQEVALLPNLPDSSQVGPDLRSEERRVGKSVDLGGRRIIKEIREIGLCE